MTVLFHEFSAFLQGVPYGIACFWVRFLYFFKYASHLCTVGVTLVRTCLFLLYVLAELSILCYISFVFQAQWTNDSHRHLVHLLHGWHRRERALEEGVEHRSVNNIVLMMSECNLVEAVFLCEAEQSLTSVPRTKETNRFVRRSGIVECSLHDVQLHAVLFGKRLQIRCV